MSLEKKVNRFFDNNVFIQRTPLSNNMVFTNYLGDSHYQVTSFMADKNDNTVLIISKAVVYNHVVITDTENYSQARKELLASVGLKIDSSSHLVSVPFYKWMREIRTNAERLEYLSPGVMNITGYKGSSMQERLDWLFEKYLGKDEEIQKEMDNK